jgi:hypothetical protein
MVMLPRDWGRGLADSDDGARGLSGDETKLGELNEREGARSPRRRRGASNVGVVGVRGDC